MGFTEAGFAELGFAAVGFAGVGFTGVGLPLVGRPWLPTPGIFPAVEAGFTGSNRAGIGVGRAGVELPAMGIEGAKGRTGVTGGAEYCCSNRGAFGVFFAVFFAVFFKGFDGFLGGSSDSESRSPAESSMTALFGISMCLEDFVGRWS